MGAWGTFLTALLAGSLCEKTNALVQWFSQWGPRTSSRRTQELVSNANAHLQAPPRPAVPSGPLGASAAALVETHGSDQQSSPP